MLAREQTKYTVNQTRVHHLDIFFSPQTQKSVNSKWDLPASLCFDNSWLLLSNRGPNSRIQQSQVGKESSPDKGKRKIMVIDRVDGKCVMTHPHYEDSPHPRATDMSRVATPVFSQHAVFHCSFLLNCFYLASSSTNRITICDETWQEIFLKKIF